MAHDPPLALSALRNLGPRSAEMLARAGIRTPAQLRRLGAVAAYRRTRRAVPGASLNLLYALVGAIENRDWLEVRRNDRLALLLSVDGMDRHTAADAALLALRNIGPAMLRDLRLLGVRSVAQLSRCDADRLYARLERITGTRQDPCVWDTFAAAIHQAKTGTALPWWQFTPERKRRQFDGNFPTPRRPRDSQ